MTVVLGGTGIIGSSLVLHLLKDNTALTLLYRSEVKKQKLISFLLHKNVSANLLHSIQWIKGNIVNNSILEDLINPNDEVYHCANFVSFDERDRKALLEINHLGTQRIVNVCLDKGVSKLAYVSSIATKDAEKNQAVIDENNTWLLSQVHSSYAESKYLAELEVWRAYAEGLKTVIINPGVILSDYDFKQSSGKLFKQLAQKFSFYSSGLLPLVDVEDVVKCLIYLMNNELYGENYIVVERSLSYEETCSIIRKSLGRGKAHFISDSWLLILQNIYKVFSTLIPYLPQFSSAFWQSLTHRYTYDTHNIKEAYPHSFEDVRISLVSYSKSYQVYESL